MRKKVVMISSFNVFLPRFYTLILFLCINKSFAVVVQENNSFGQSVMQNTVDSIVRNHKKQIDYFSVKKDTVGLINQLMELSAYYSHIVDYGNSYDGYWRALILADKSNDNISKSKIYQALGWMYLFYRRDKEAIKYFNLSLAIKKELFKQKKIDIGYIGSDYFSLVNLYRTNNDLESAKIYLDSCINIQSASTIKSYYIDAERGYVNGVSNNFEEAFKDLDNASEFFVENDPAYMVIVNYLYAKVYEKKEDFVKSIFYYKKSLELITLYNRHTNYFLMVNEALASLYAKNGMFKEAYFHRNEASRLNAKIFGRKSQNNRHLFEIKDKHRIQIEKEKELIKEQRIALLEKEEKVAFLKMGLMTVVIISLIVYGILLFKNIRRKHKLEKKSLKEKKDLELQKANEILELKNKELTSSALQLIEKEEFLTKLKNNISDKEVDVNSVGRMLNSISGSPGSNWKEFEARFTSINQSFYKEIKDKHPGLGKTDLKICALVKLDFSSKDMSSLLGISIESVHTSRHRLRKKLNLKREDNLTDFMSNF